MVEALLHGLLGRAAKTHATATALIFNDREWTYGQLYDTCAGLAYGLSELGVARQDRVAIYLPKCPEAVAGMFGTAAAGAVFVPVNPVLKAEQVGHILRDSEARVLITSRDRLGLLRDTLQECPALQAVIVTHSARQADEAEPAGYREVAWTEVVSHAPAEAGHARVIDTDMAALLYTSGSTGKPKGVVLTHRNMVTGARSVAQYLGNTENDRLLAVLPFSFDYGFSQLSTAFSVGASVKLLDYLLPNDVIKAIARDGVTGLAGVPPLWVQLARLKWPPEARAALRYITNSGGKMPRATLNQLRELLPEAEVFLMYGLTEAFRSTFLPPAELDRRPDSIGKAIPNAEVMVVRDDGTPCEPNEPGELVHRGSLVARGYWNDPEKTAERFKPVPAQHRALVLPETAVWSGDTVYRDDEGFLYFVGRHDDMIKTSGFRVSPTEVEEVVYGTGLVSECAALGVADARLGQTIVVAAAGTWADDDTTQQIVVRCRAHLANYMVPSRIVWLSSLPRNPNGKIDRRSITIDLSRELTDNTND